MWGKYLWLYAALHLVTFISCEELLGCGGFLKSHVQIDFSKVLIKLITKSGVVKDQTNCAPKTGYYFIPLYDKGDYLLQLEPPPGWSFTPQQVEVSVNGKSDLCSQGKDINFVFKGFGIAGKVESSGSSSGPAGVEVELISDNEVRNTITDSQGVFFFTPVYPGKYEVVASHPKWTFTKDKIVVTVTEGNTELPSGSLVIGGYDVTGYVKINNAPVARAKILIFPQSQNAKLSGCETTLLANYKGPKPGCYVTTDSSGAYVFPSVASGKYKIIAFMDNLIHFEPTSQEFELQHDSHLISKNFEITALTAHGLVKLGEKPLAGIQIILDNEQQGLTREDGSYILDKVKPGSHVIKATADEYKFSSLDVKLAPDSTAIKTITPNTFKVCGSVISDKMEPHSISLTKMGSTTHVVVQSDANTGTFCEFLPPGKYQVQVNTPDKTTLFFPLIKTVEVFEPVTNVVFSQLKVTVSGRVKCIKQDDCKRLKVILRPVDKADEIIVNVIEGLYKVNDIRPGEYLITLSSNRLCWDKEKHVIQVSNATSEAPTFINTGYAVTFISTHDTYVKYGSNKITVTRGTSQHCLPTPGSYQFHLESCHRYENDVVEYKTSQEINEVVLNALQHKTTVVLSAIENLGDIFMGVSINGGEKMLKGPLKYQSNDKTYVIDLYLSANDHAVLTPKSDTVFFDPPITSISGQEDCSDLGIKFIAKRGKVFRGKVIPPIAGVQINVLVDNSESLTTETESDGSYKFPALDDSKQYELTASKESYVFVHDGQGNFAANKLAEIIVEVVDESNNLPLPAALLSLSGAGSYRSNLQTNDSGTVAFRGLFPNEYFLKPMLKEYSFDPPSKSINVLVGASEKIVWKGKRVAYSSYGQVVTLANQGERNMIVVASGINNCTQYAEEATTDVSGFFRIRGLVPYCSYKIVVKGSTQPNDPIDRVLPPEVIAKSVSGDVTDLKLIVFRPAANTDLYVKVFTENAEHYRSLRLKITRESSPSGLVHNLKVDLYKVSPDNNIGILFSAPSLPMDKKLYSVQLESVNGAIKGQSSVVTFTADNSYKFVAVNFVAKNNITEQQIKQVSLWKVAFFFLLVLGGYKFYNSLYLRAKANNINLPNFFGNIGKLKTNPPEQHHQRGDGEVVRVVKNVNYRRGQKDRLLASDKDNF